MNTCKNIKEGQGEEYLAPLLGFFKFNDLGNVFINSYFPGNFDRLSSRADF
jgi:hypothetical protein